MYKLYSITLTGVGYCAFTILIWTNIYYVVILAWLGFKNLNENKKKVVGPVNKTVEIFKIRPSLKDIALFDKFGFSF